MLVPTARKVWVDTSTPLLFSGFWADDAVSLSTTPLTFVCLGADKTVVVANSHACGCTLNAQTGCRSWHCKSTQESWVRTELQLTLQSRTSCINLDQNSRIIRSNEGMRKHIISTKKMQWSDHEGWLCSPWMQRSSSISNQVSTIKSCLKSSGIQAHRSFRGKNEKEKQWVFGRDGVLLILSIILSY